MSHREPRKGFAMKKLLVLGGLSAPLLSMAAVDAAVTTAVSGAFTDAGTVAVAVTVGAAALWAALLIKRKFFG
jgi:hypothetical protein